MFTIDELTILKMYAEISPNRDKVISALINALPFIEDVEISTIVKELLHKVTSITQNQFDTINFDNNILCDEVSK